MASPQIIILGHMDKPGLADQIDSLTDWFAQRADILAICPANKVDAACISKADLCVVFGGDGTLLTAARQLADADVPLLGVNMGKLGFLAEFTVEAMKEHFDAILAGEIAPTQRMLLDICVAGNGGETFCSRAVNDVAIVAGEPHRMIQLNVTRGDQCVSSVLGDGLIVATPTGSTAYNLSVGGPLVDPLLDAVVVSPIAPHTLSLRPMVLGAEEPLTITAARVNPGTAVMVDGQATTSLAAGDTVTIRRADKTVKIVPCPGRGFFDVLSDKLHWGHGPNYNGQ